MTRTENPPSRVVLNVGSGPPRRTGLHPCFKGPGWREVRLDIDPRTRPDIVGTVTDLRPHCADRSFDALWSSHNIEHLFSHEVPVALSEFRRVLKPQGFALVTCPDLQAVAADLIAFGPDHVAYLSPAGPITVNDMLFGHGASIAAGNAFMAHNTGFTQDRLGAAAKAAGFSEVRVGRGDAYDLWAFLSMPDCTVADLRALSRGSALEFLFPDDAQG